MKFLKFSLALLFATVVFSACNNDGSSMIFVKPNGNVINKDYEVQEFDQIKLLVDAEVEIVKGDYFKVQADASENIHPILMADVTDGVLVLRTKWERTIRGKSDVRFVITCPQLASVNLASQGNIYVKGPFNDEKVEFFVSGSGALKLGSLSYREAYFGITGSGNISIENSMESGIHPLDIENGERVLPGNLAHFCEINVSGSGQVIAHTVPVNKAKVSISGSGNAELFVKKDLIANISGSGNIYYHGSPNIEKYISGSGQLKHLK